MMSEGHECKLVGMYKTHKLYQDCQTNNVFILSGPQNPGIDSRLYESDSLDKLTHIVDTMERVTPH